MEQFWGPAVTLLSPHFHLSHCQTSATRSCPHSWLPGAGTSSYQGLFPFTGGLRLPSQPLLGGPAPRKMLDL